MPSLPSAGCVSSTHPPLHVDDDLQYLYTPADIALFEYTHTAISGVRDLLQEERGHRAPKGNPFLSRFRRGTPQFALVESLRASTDLVELRRLAEPVAGGGTTITTLRDRVRNLDGAGQQVQLAGARATQALCVSAIGAADRLLAFDAEEYTRALADLSASQRKVREVSEALFAGDDLPGLFTAEWTAFITAAHQYGRDHVSSSFPDDSDECPYCRQVLNDKSHQLLQKYKAYLVDNSQADLRTAMQSLATLVAPIVNLVLPQQPSSEAGSGDTEVTVEALAIAEIRKLGLRQQERLAQRQSWELDAEIGQLRADRQMLDEQRQAAAQAATDLSTEDTQREARLAEAKTALIELEDRGALRSLLDGVVEHVEAAKWVDLADTVLRSFQGLLRSLTDTMKDATAGILNTSFETAFQHECQLLNCPPVRLEFPGRQAATLRHKSVGDNHRLGAVLSEGEQKVIALADFLAEVSMRPSSGPIILDDPITSLDAQRVDEVAERIINLSGEHQVIVFTHHLFFATKLLAAFEQSSVRSQCSFYEVLAEDGKVGLVSRGSHPRMDTVKAYNGRIRAALQDAHAASGTARSDLIATAYGHMRGWIEAFVEDELLQAAVKRHRANISIDALSRVNGQAMDESVRILQPIFERACDRMWPHAHTADQLQARPTIDEVDADWAALQSVADAVKTGTFPIPMPADQQG